MDEQIIRLAYLLFFGREPENESVVKEKARRLKTVQDVRTDFINSDEFKKFAQRHYK
jgi:hypothetical protein